MLENSLFDFCATNKLWSALSISFAFNIHLPCEAKICNHARCIFFSRYRAISRHWKCKACCSRKKIEELKKKGRESSNFGRKFFFAVKYRGASVVHFVTFFWCFFFILKAFSKLHFSIGSSDFIFIHAS